MSTHFSSMILKTVPFALAGSIALFAVTALAANPFSSIQFPIPELGNCTDMAACKAYCDISANADACRAYGEAHGLIRRREVMNTETASNATSSKIDALVRGGAGPGGCSNMQECRTFCSDTTHMQECRAFAERHGFGGGKGDERMHIQVGSSTPPRGDDSQGGNRDGGRSPIVRRIEDNATLKNCIISVIGADGLVSLEAGTPPRDASTMTALRDCFGMPHGNEAEGTHHSDGTVGSSTGDEAPPGVHGPEMRGMRPMPFAPGAQNGFGSSTGRRFGGMHVEGTDSSPSHQQTSDMHTPSPFMRGQRTSPFMRGSLDGRGPLNPDGGDQGGDTNRLDRQRGGFDGRAHGFDTMPKGPMLMRGNEGGGSQNDGENEGSGPTSFLGTKDFVASVYAAFSSLLQ